MSWCRERAGTESGTHMVHAQDPYKLLQGNILLNNEALYIIIKHYQPRIISNW